MLGGLRGAAMSAVARRGWRKVALRVPQPVGCQPGEVAGVTEPPK